MELRHLLKVLLRWWWVVAVPVVVVGGLTLWSYRPPPTSYQVVLRFAAGSEPGGLSKDYDRYYNWLASEYVANGLADIARTGAFAEAVARRLQAEGVDVTPAALQAAIVSDNAQSILVVYVTWPDPQVLRRIAEAVAAELREGGGGYFPQMEGVGEVARLLDTPSPVPLPPSLRAQLAGPLLRLLLALAVGVGAALLVHTLDPFVREASEVEALGIPVIIEVPRRSS